MAGHALAAYVQQTRKACAASRPAQACTHAYLPQSSYAGALAVTCSAVSQARAPGIAVILV